MMNQSCHRKTEKVYVKVTSDLMQQVICSPDKLHGVMGEPIPSNRYEIFALQIPLPIYPAIAIL